MDGLDLSFFQGYTKLLNVHIIVRELNVATNDHSVDQSRDQTINVLNIKGNTGEITVKTVIKPGAAAAAAAPGAASSLLFAF